MLACVKPDFDACAEKTARKKTSIWEGDPRITDATLSVMRKKLKDKYRQREDAKLEAKRKQYDEQYAPSPPPADVCTAALPQNTEEDAVAKRASFVRSPHSRETKETSDKLIIKYLREHFGDNLPNHQLKAVVLDSLPDFPTSTALLKSELVHPPVQVVERKRKTFHQMNVAAAKNPNIIVTRGYLGRTIFERRTIVPDYNLIYLDSQRTYTGNKDCLTNIVRYLKHQRPTCVLACTFSYRKEGDTAQKRNAYCTELDQQLKSAGYDVNRFCGPRKAGDMWMYISGLRRTSSRRRSPLSNKRTPPAEPPSSSRPAKAQKTAATPPPQDEGEPGTLPDSNDYAPPRSPSPDAHPTPTSWIITRLKEIEAVENPEYDLWDTDLVVKEVEKIQKRHHEISDDAALTRALHVVAHATIHHSSVVRKLNSYVREGRSRANRIINIRKAGSEAVETSWGGKLECGIYEGSMPDEKKGFVIQDDLINLYSLMFLYGEHGHDTMAMDRCSKRTGAFAAVHYVLEKLTSPQFISKYDDFLYYIDTDAIVKKGSSSLKSVYVPAGLLSNRHSDGPFGYLAALDYCSQPNTSYGIRQELSKLGIPMRGSIRLYYGWHKLNKNQKTLRTSLWELQLKWDRTENRGGFRKTAFSFGALVDHLATTTRGQDMTPHDIAASFLDSATFTLLFAYRYQFNKDTWMTDIYMWDHCIEGRIETWSNDSK